MSQYPLLFVDSIVSDDFTFYYFHASNDLCHLLLAHVYTATSFLALISVIVMVSDNFTFYYFHASSDFCHLLITHVCTAFPFLD